jgi:arabinose-5-phosphate isomerase
MEQRDIFEAARLMITAESQALVRLADSLDNAFERAVEQILTISGRVVVSGVGKSGYIARKVAATLSSTGTVATFVHPVEASHGDLGMIRENDLLIALSRSGESNELDDIVTYCSDLRLPIIAITSNAASKLSRKSSITLLMPDLNEACTLGLAPTNSSIMMLSMGDALANCCLIKRGFTKDDFKKLHPAGSLGRLLLKASDVMHGNDQVPLVNEYGTVFDAILEMTRCRFGCVGVINAQEKLIGIFTDGDLRRKSAYLDLTQPITKLMSPNPKFVEPSVKLSDIIKILKNCRIPSIFVCAECRPIGILHIHDFLQIGLA